MASNHINTGSTAVPDSLSSAISLQEVLDSIICRAVGLVGAQDGSLMLLEEDGQLHFRARCGDLFPMDKEERTFTPGAPDQGITGWVAHNRRSYVCQDTKTDSNFVDIVAGASIRSLVSVPIISHSTVLGVINVGSSESSRFSESDAELLVALADQVAVTIERAELLESLRQIGEKIIDGTEDPHQYIVDAVHRFIRCSVAMWRVDETRKQARIVASRGVRSEYAQKVVVDLDRSVIGKAIRKREIVQVLDIQADPDFQNKEAAAREGWQSYLAVPLLAGPKYAVGTLSIYSERKREQFTRWELDLLRTFARQAGVVIRNADLAKELTVVNEIGQTVSTLGVEAIANLVYQKTSQLMDTTNFFLCLYNKKMNRLDIKTWIHNGRSLEPFSRDLSESGPTGWVIQEEKPLLIRDWDEEEQDFPTKPYIVTERQRSWLGVPLRIGEEVIGVMSVQSSHPNAFDPDNQRLLEIIANQAAVAIENARLFEESQNRLKLLNALHETSIDIAQRLEWGELVPAVIERAANLMAGERHRGLGAAYWLCDHEKQRAIIEYSPNPVLVGVELGFDEGLVGEVVQTGKAKYVNNYPQWSQRAAIFDRDDLAGLIKNVIEVPIRENDKIVAVLAISDASGQRRFGDADIDVLERFANLAAVAIQNAHLLQQERDLRRQTETLQEVLGATRAALELKEVAGRILDELGEVVEYRRASLQLVREDARVLLAGRGFDVEVIDPWFLRPFSQDRLVRRIIVDKEPLILSETSEDPDWIPRSGTLDVKSWVGLPLFFEQEAIGFLTLDHTQPGFYTQAVRDLLVPFANQAASEIWQAHLFDSAQRRIRDLEIVNEVVQVISKELDTRVLLQTIISQIVDRLNCTHCTVFFPQKEKDELLLVPEETHGARSEQIRTRRFELDEGLVGWVFQHGESLVLDDARKDPRFAPAREGQDRPRSMLVVPVKVGDQTIGVISADQDKFGWFSESDRRLVDALARHAGIAIERAIGLQLLQDIGNRIIRAPNVSDILQQIVTGAITLTNTNSGVIYLISEDGQSVIGSFHPPGFDHPRPRLERKEGLTRHVIISGEALCIPDIRQDPRVNPVLLEHFQSMIAIPLKIEQRVIGVLYLNDADPHDFNETEVSLLQTLASQAASAIENAKLFERIQEQRVAQIRAIREIGKSIAASLKLEQVLEGILDWTVSLMGEASLGEVRLLDRKSNRLVVEASRGEAIEEKYREILVGKGITGWVAQHKRSQMVLDVLKDDRYLPFLEGTRSEIAVPMLKGDELIGVLNIEHPQVNAFSDSDVKLAEAIAELAVVAIENTRLFRETSNRAQTLRQLHTVGQSILALPEPDQTLQTLLTHIANCALDALQADLVELYEYDQTKRDFSLPPISVGAHISPTWIPPTEILGGSLPAQVVDGGQPYYISDAQEHPLLTRPFPASATKLPSRFAIREQIASVAAIPLIAGDQIVGVMFVNYRTPILFTQERKELIDLFGSQAVIAIQNARMYADLLQKVKELEDAQSEIANKERALVIVTMAADYVHKVNNLAGTLPNWVALAKKKLDPDSERNKQVLHYLESIAQDSRLLLDEARRLRDPLPSPEEIDVYELVNSILAQMELIAAPEIDFVIQSEPNLGRVCAVRTQLSDALFNVLDNGVKAISGAGELSVSLKRDADRPRDFIMIEISDTGRGIPPDRLNTIFELGKTYRRGSKGIGYGLWRTRTIVEGIGGSISAKSTEAEGTTFSITLPTIQSGKEANLEDNQ